MKKPISLILTIIFAVSVFSVCAYAQDGDDITLSLSVYEQANGKYLAWKPDLTVSDDSSVLDVLQAAGLNVALTDDEITAIGDIANGQYGDSRWTFTVNGVSTNINAAKYIPSNGDKISFLYEVNQPTTADTTQISEIVQTTEYTTMTTDITNTASETTQPTASEFTAASTSATVVPSTVKSTQAATTESITVSQNDIISSSLSYAKTQNTEFKPLVLSCYSRAIDKSIREQIIKAADKAETLTPTQLSALIINAAAIGFSADNVNGVDLSKRLLNEQNIMSTGLYGAIYGKFALEHCIGDDAKTLETAKDNVTALILQNQNDDGSFSQTYGEKPDVSVTALALAALSDSLPNTDVSSAVDKALLWLINAQNRDGSFSDVNGNPDCAATARVIIALQALGIKNNDERFVREHNTYEALLDFFNGTAFSADIGGTSDANATEAALLALFSYNHSSNPYTLKVNSHLEKLNVRLFGIIALVLLISLGAALIIMKKKGFFDNSSANNNQSKGDNPPNV